MIGFVYILIASGFHDAGYPFWRAVIWPSEVGLRLAEWCSKPGRPGTTAKEDSQ